MGEIGILVNSTDMYIQAQEVVKESSAEEVDVVLTHTYSESLGWVKKLVQKGCRIIIARGGHTMRLREAHLNIPIIDIPFTGNNIAILLMKAKKEYDQFAVVGNSLLLRMVREFDDAIGGGIHYFEVTQWDDFERQINRVKEQGLRVVVGGYDATSFAETKKLNSLCITTSELEISTAFYEAQKTLGVYDRERRWNEIFRIVLDSIREGIVLLDDKGVITHNNKLANKLLNGGVPLGSQIPDGQLKGMVTETLRTGLCIYDELNETSGYQHIDSIMPIKIKNRSDGAVIVLQEAEYVQKIEQKIRQNSAQRGLVASKTFDDILGSSAQIRETIETAREYSAVDSTVLIFGESGTGKEMFAQSIHNAGPRKNEAFVAINCATIPANLLESELFGYAEGAFTGARKGGKPGLFELAHKGTIFLDEIGEISYDMQARLLRILEERKIMRIGADRMLPVDVRVIAATNKDMWQMVREGKFREDFYYRLNVLSLNLPPLRQRREDLMLLIEHFLIFFSQRHSRRDIRIHADGMKIFLEYGWPGNVREVRNVVERLVVTSRDGTLIGADQAKAMLPGTASCGTLPPGQAVPAPSEAGLYQKNERALILRVLKETGGNKTEAAKKLGISRVTLHRKLKQMAENGENSGV